MSQANRTVVLGFDACDPNLVHRWAHRGQLPNFARLLLRSARAAVRHDPWFYVASLWPSFTTAREPMHHGFTCWAAIEPGTYDDADLPIGPSLGQPFWEAVGQTGRRVAVIDVPHSWLPRDLDGVVVVDRSSHDLHGPARSFPASAANDLDERAGPPVFVHAGPTMAGPCDRELRAGPIRTADEERELHGRLAEARERSGRAALALLEQERWDLFCAVLADTHCTGHQLWHLHDGRHPRHDPALAAELGDPVLDSYRHADETLGAVMDRLDDDTILFVLLSHGMGPAYHGSALFEPLLTRAAEVWRGDAPSARHPLGAQPSTDHHPLDRPSAPWFGVPGPQALAGVRLNLVGREPEGILTPGDDADRAADALSAFLLEVVDVRTGRPAVESVERTATRVARASNDRLPDLVVRWRDDAPLLWVWSARLGQVATRVGQWRSGDHRHDAELLVAGPDIAAGDRPTLAITDVPASIAAASGAVLADVDGRPRADLLSRRAGSLLTPAPSR